MKVLSVLNQSYKILKPVENKNDKNKVKSSNSFSCEGLPKFNKTNFIVSFGWCEKHSVRSKEVSLIFMNQLRKQKELEKLEEREKTRLEYLDISEKAHKESLNFLMQFANRQKNEAEFIPLWSLMNNEELREEVQKSKIFSDPVASLISLNLLQEIKVKNNSITPEQLQKAQGSLQLHTAVILVNQIEKNLDNKELLAAYDKAMIVELLSIVKSQLDSIYGKGVYDKVLKLSNIGTEPDFSSKKESLEILTKIDNEAKPLTLGKEFSEKLNNLLARQKQLEYEKLSIEQMYGQRIVLGGELTDAQRSKLNSICRNSSSVKERKTAEFMLKLNKEVRFSKEKLSPKNLHHREHILGLATHSHSHSHDEGELEEVDVHYHEHSHNGHTHKH